MTDNLHRWIGHNLNNDREKDDFYATPQYAVEALLKQETFDGNIWECACGDGALSEILKKNNYDVYSSDLIDRGYGETGIDFLLTNRKADNIITNPPFKLANEFTLKSFDVTNNKIALFLKLSFLEGITRNNKIFSQNYLKNVYVFSKRVSFENKKGSGMMAFAWFVYDMQYQGLPTLNWI